MNHNNSKQAQRLRNLLQAAKNTLEQLKLDNKTDTIAYQRALTKKHNAEQKLIEKGYDWE